MHLQHSFPEFRFSWRKQIPLLVERGYTVVVPDLHGYNDTDKPRTRYDVPTLLRDIAGLIKGIELTYDLEQWVPNLQMKRIPDSGHWVQQEKPELVNTLMAEFLQGYYCSWFTANHGGANASGQQ